MGTYKKKKISSSNRTRRNTQFRNVDEYADNRNMTPKRKKHRRLGIESYIVIALFVLFGVLWFFLGSSLVFGTEHIYKVQGKGILIFVLFRGRRKRLQFRV